MEKPSNNAFTPEEVKSLYDKWWAGLSAEEQKLVEGSKWDPEKNVPFKDGYLEFVNANSDGSPEAIESIFMYAENLDKNFKDAVKSQNIELQKFFEIFKRLQLPMTLSPEEEKSLKTKVEERLQNEKGEQQGETQETPPPKEKPPVQETPRGNETPQSEAKEGTLMGAIQSTLDKRHKKPEEKSGKPKENKEQVNFRKELEKLLGTLDSDQRDMLKISKWEDPDREWRLTDKKWIDGFMEYFNKRLEKGGASGAVVFTDYIEKLKEKYKEAERKGERKNYRSYKAQFELAEKMFELFKEEKEKNKDDSELLNLGNVWGIKNIVKSVKRAVRQILGMKEPANDNGNDSSAAAA